MKRRIAFLIAIMLVCFILSPVRVMATATEYAVDFVITINPDGSADFVETHTIRFSESKDYTRYGRIYIYPEGRAMGNWEVTVDGESWEALPKVDNDTRPDGTFAVEYNDEGAVVTMYHHSIDTDRAFSLSYHVENAVNIYEDTAEFFWNLSSENELSIIYYMTAQVILPESLTEEDFRIWAHGPLAGVFNKDGGNFASLKVDFVPTYNPVDIRIAMPVEAFSGGYEIGGEFLQTIFDEEQELADKANAKREEEERSRAEQVKYQEEWDRKHPIQAWVNRHYTQTPLVLAIATSGIIPLVIIYPKISKLIKKGKTKKMRRKPAVAPQYYRTLPDQRPSAVVGFLVQYYGNREYGNYFTATLMEMSLKGHLTMKGDEEETFIVLNDSDVPLLAHEKVLYDMLKKAANDQPSLSFKKLQKEINKDPGWAVGERNSFNAKVEEQFKETVTIDDLTKPSQKKKIWLKVLIYAIACAIVGIILGPFIAVDIEAYEFFTDRLKAALIGFGIAAIWVLGIKMINSGRQILALSQKDEDSMALWQAFGRFLDDFTLFDEKELPEFSVWKEYIVYAVALGKGKKLIKDLAVRYPSLMSDGDNTYFSAFYHNGRFNDAFFDTLDKVQKTTYQARVYESSSSSGSGGGGGFSSSGGGSNSGSGGGFAD